MQGDQENIADALSNIPVKRKRGRPRKYPRLDPQENAAPVPRYQNLNLGENAAVPPPGFVRSNGNQAQQAAPTNGTSTTDNMVGMVVSGVVEASFDAGYLLRVRVGNTGTTLRGVVFKPGHYAPVVPENDVAPDVEMIRRHEIPLPVENHSSVHGHKPHSRDASRPVNHVASEGQQVVPVAAQNVNRVMPRGNLMPVVLEPCKVSNGPALTSESNPVATQAATVATSKGKQVVSAAPSNVCSIPKDQASAVQNQMLGSQPHTSHQVMYDAKINENGPTDPPSVEELRKTEAKLMPENVPSESAESHVEASNLATQPLVEPLQEVEHKDHPTSASKPMEDGRNGKMSELLQVLQESMKERMKDQTEKLFGDGQNDQSSTPSQAS
ncbi:hypothetical protein ABKV19_004830 [Rosa sericea]